VKLSVNKYYSRDDRITIANRSYNLPVYFGRDICDTPDFVLLTDNYK
jgi:hypothetical protein